MPHKSKPSSAARCLIAAELSMGLLALLDQLSKNVRQDAAVREGDQFLWCVDACDDGEGLRAAVLSARQDRDLAPRRQRRARAEEREHFTARQANRHRGLAGLELQRQHAHVDEITAVNALVTFG